MCFFIFINVVSKQGIVEGLPNRFCAVLGNSALYQQVDEKYKKTCTIDRSSAHQVNCQWSLSVCVRKGNKA